jgi:hypothetical protein
VCSVLPHLPHSVAKKENERRLAVVDFSPPIADKAAHKMRPRMANARSIQIIMSATDPTTVMIVAQMYVKAPARTLARA